MLFDKLEKIEKTLYPLGNNISLKAVVMTGRKSTNGGRLSGDYVNNGKTAKYNDTSEVLYSNINTQEYGSFTKFTKGELPVDLYFSYPHIAVLLSGFIKAASDIRKNQTEYFFIDDEDNKLYFNADYSEKSFSIGPLVGGKSIMIVPHVVTYPDTDRADEPGALVMFGEENINTSMSIHQLESFVFYLKNEFSLTTITSAMTTFAAVQMLDYKGVSGSGSSNSNSETPATAKTNFRTRMRSKSKNATNSSVLEDETPVKEDSVTEEDISNIFDEVAEKNTNKDKLIEKANDVTEEVEDLSDDEKRILDRLKTNTNDFPSDPFADDTESEETTDKEPVKNENVSPAAGLMSKDILKAKSNDEDLDDLFD